DSILAGFKVLYASLDAFKIRLHGLFFSIKNKTFPPSMAVRCWITQELVTEDHYALQSSALPTAL
ncbi:hypothetical protein ACWXWU_20395, partial [Shewanella sp. A14]